MKGRSKLADLPAVLRDCLGRHLRSKRETPAVLVAVSGGADSMALLAAAQELSSKGEIRLSAAHLIHQPESDEANHRAKLVRNYCRRHKIPLVVDTLQTEGDEDLSPEERMRQARYRFLEEAARRQDCDWIFTGHQADDRAETVLLRILSGTGLRGLAGIPEQRGKVLRPFLSLRKLDLVKYCQDQGISYSDDPANLDLQVPRNCIRSELLPLIEDRLNPDAAGALCRLSRWAAEANEIIEEQISDCFNKSLLNFQKGKIVLDIQVILTYFKLIQKYTILEAISRLRGPGVQLSAADLDRIAEFSQRGRTGSYLKFAEGIRVVRDRRSLIIYSDPLPRLHCRLVPGMDQGIPELSLRVVWSKHGSKPFLVGDGPAADLFIGPEPCELTLRYGEEGDRFFPLGAPGEKKLFRFLTDRRVSRFEKRATPVLVKNREIIWVVGHRISERVRARTDVDGTWRLRMMSSEGEGGLASGQPDES